ncbi:MAG: NADP-dependent isocitrate dehydrogenase [Candidatus Calescibacterium sp.]|nr:NADP-dependent isocitrate dehydrogenase [Candidatus Calescibacterium sp.]MCX7971776.1 NADP-dependent isocitrate dehydrogenase [bacterium]MDW8195382.1 NADP-dependent isocitrate dehydrogenase [Candidatus Calescibacterium sp.]
MRRVTLIEGDGIGKEICESVIKIFEAAKVPIEWDKKPAGLECYQKHGTPLPEETLNSIKLNKVALKGPTTTPIGTGHKSVNVTIRKSLELFANVRPAKTLPGIETKFGNIDIVVIRENIEDTYGAIEHMETPDVAQTLRIITRQGSFMIHSFAFQYAKTNNRKKLTCVHKANIQKMSDGLFLNTFRELSTQYPDIETEDIIVDNLCMKLVTNPEKFDVLVLPNIFGDIVSDLCAGLVGGLGLAPSANIGKNLAVFEAVHGSAPDIAGKNIANPTAFILSSTMMLKHIGMKDYAERIERALENTLKAGIKTKDLGGNYSTTEFTQAIIKEINKNQTYIELPAKKKENEIKFFDPPAPTPSEDWQIIGIDLFIEWNNIETLPEVPKKVEKLELKMISNRGTKIYPPPVPEILMVNWYRCRYLSNQALSHQDILEFLKKITELQIKWMHIEILRKHNDKELFSKAQGE